MIRIRRAAGPDEGDIRAPADVLIDCVEGGASVSFMAPMTREKAESFSRRVLESAARDERIALAAEREARAAGKTLLVLDTASTEAERLYRRGGWHPVGVIPAYALLPDGTPCATTYFYKSLVG